MITGTIINSAIIIFVYVSIWFIIATIIKRNDIIDIAWGLGYIVLFKLTVKKLGAWYPLHEPYTNILNTALPLLDPLLDGVFPAFSEEALSRLFSISFLLFMTKRKSLALVIPAVIWAFCHSWYLTSPIYLRGIELTVKGIISVAW